MAIVRLSGNVRETLEAALRLIGGFHLGSLPIYIKPNLCAETDPEGGANIGVGFLRGVIDLILKQKSAASIKIIESDSSDKHADKAFVSIGYTQLIDEYSKDRLSLVNLTKEPKETVSLDGLYLKRVELPRILLQPHFLISVAKAKTHDLTEITGVLKNQFGCLPDPRKSSYHHHIHEVIVDLNRVVRPDLCIVDGSVCMEGVVEGRLRSLGAVICGYDPVATDATLARVMGLDPYGIRHLMLAWRAGLGTLEPRVVGESVERVAIKVHRPSTAVKTVSRLVPTSLRPMAKGVYYRFLARRGPD